MNEQASQLVTIGVGLLDRILLTAILFRIWGASTFEQWSAIAALASLGSLFEFGFNLYFNNRITFETERGQNEAAARTLFIANGIFALCAATGIVVMFAIVLSSHFDSIATEGPVVLATLMLVTGTVMRVLTNGVSAQYRANRRFARFSYIVATGETARVVATGLVVIAGADLLGAALATMLAQLGILVAFILYDSRRLFPPHRLGFTLPPRDDIRPIIAQSSGYFGQVVPVMMFTAVPVLFLQSQGLAAGVLASFLLVRTLANLARTPLQAFGIVIGQEFGRRIALNDRPGAFAVLDAGAHFFSVLSGLAFGIVTVAGSIIIHIWAGSASVYSLPLAIAALFPMLIGAVSILGHNILVASQMPFAAMLGRWVQVALTLIAYWLLPVDDLALRVMIALSVGELLGFAPVAYAAVERMVPDAAVSFHLRHIARTLFSAVFAAGLSAALIAMIPPERLLTQLVILALIGSVALIWVAFVGVSKATRMRLIDNLRPHGQSPAP